MRILCCIIGGSHTIKSYSKLTPSPEFAGKLATYTPYTTRHTYASLCDRAGVNKDILKRAVGHTPKSQTLDEVYLHPKATQMIEAFDKANQLVNDEVLTTTKA